MLFLTDFIRNHTIRPSEGFAGKLKSKLKDSLYLIALRLSSDSEGYKKLEMSEDSNGILEEAADMLNEILDRYLAHNRKPEYLMHVEERNRLLVHEATFRAYFQNGKLNYREQELNHVRRMFSPYQEKIVDRLGISLQVLIDICEYSEELFMKKREAAYSFLNTVEFQEIAPLLADGKIKGELYSELLEKLPHSFFDFVEKPHGSSTFKKEDLTVRFTEKQVDVFCSLFSMDLQKKLDFTFYTQTNPLEDCPIIELSNSEYIHVYQKQLPTSLYNLLYRTLGETKSEVNKLYHRRGKIVLENQIAELLKTFFRKAKGYRIFQNYYLDGSENEKDLLIISNYYAFIVECKASKFREPLRDLSRAFGRIKDDFKACIQHGYDQCLEVEQRCWDDNGITIVTEKGKKTDFVKTNGLMEVFSIVVTWERFGPIQTNLGYLLSKKLETDFFPWSVCIDDFEIFLRSLTVLKKNPVRSFIDYLLTREGLNGKLLAQDELDVCSMYLQNENTFEQISSKNDFILTDPALQNFFDTLYFDKKLKFPNVKL